MLNSASASKHQKQGKKQHASTKHNVESKTDQNSQYSNGLPSAFNFYNSLQEVKKQTKLVDPVLNSMENFHDIHKLPNNFVPTFARGPVDETEQVQLDRPEYAQYPSPVFASPCVPSQFVACPTVSLVPAHKDASQVNNPLQLSNPKPNISPLAGKKEILHYGSKTQEKPIQPNVPLHRQSWGKSIFIFICWCFSSLLSYI